MRINYEFNDLEAFLAVKETGSFHLAAERLNLSQSAVTRRVQKLETALDTVLFERTTREVRPTLAAKRLQTRAEAILEAAQETSLAMRDESIAFEYQRNLVITVAVIPTIISSLMTPAIMKFREQGQKARIRFLDHTANTVAETVAKGDADFGIGSITEIEQSTQFEHLFDDQIVLVHRRDHPIFRLSRLDWLDLESENLIVPTRGTGNRLLIDEAMARSSLPLQWSYEVRRSATALDLVFAGIGVALLPKSAVLQTHSTEITFKEISKPKIVRAVGFLDRIGHKPSVAEQILKSSIRKAATEFGFLESA